jgi:hypothetical protein
VAVDDGEGALVEIAAFLVVQLIACLPRPFGGCENLVALGLLRFGRRLLHFKPTLHEKPPVAKNVAEIVKTRQTVERDCVGDQLLRAQPRSAKCPLQPDAG